MANQKRKYIHLLIFENGTHYTLSPATLVDVGFFFPKLLALTDKTTQTIYKNISIGWSTKFDLGRILNKESWLRARKERRSS